MANYSTYTAKFNPFTYDEMIKPLKEMAQEHTLIEQGYGELGAKAAEWEKLANNAIDKDMYDLYKSYANRLREQADNLARNGLNYSSRRDLMNMATEYTKDINPIKEAWNAREKQIVEQDKQREQEGDQIVFSNDARETPLSTYYKRDNVSYTRNNLDNMHKDATEMAINASKRKWRIKEGSKYFGNTRFSMVTENGYRETEIDDILNALDIDYNNYLSAESINKVRNLSPDLAAYLTHMKERYNWDEYNDRDKKRMSASIINGINKGLGYQLNTQLYDNYDARRGEGNSSKIINPAYRLQSRIDVDQDSKTSTWKDYIDFLTKIIADPELMNEEKTVIYTSTGLQGALPYMHYQTVYPNKEKYKKILEELNDDIGVNASITPGYLIGILNNKIEKSAVKGYNVYVNTTNAKNISTTLLQNAAAHNRIKEDETGFMELNDDNTTEKEEDLKKIQKVVNDDSFYYYDPVLDTMVVGGVVDGKAKHYTISEDLYDPHNIFTAQRKAMKEALDKGDYMLYNRLRNDYVESFYTMFNTQAQRQSETSSNPR